MFEEIRMCVDKPIPPEMKDEADRLAMLENPANIPSPLEIAGLTKYFWSPGRTLRVRFLDGLPEVQARVEAVAHQWSNFANIRFDFGNDPDAEIRISFQGEGSWSYIGTVALIIPKNEPTMNYGWLTPETDDEEYSRVVLHEFGHALGCIHEHQHPENGIPWDVEKVYAYYMQTQGWDKETVDINVLGAYDKDSTQYTAFDPFSIMLYPIPKALTLNGFEIPWRNSQLSELDRTFIAQVYPHDMAAFDTAVLAGNGKLYVFRGDRYVRLTPGAGVDPGYPRPIAGNWGSMPAAFTAGIDAAITMPDGKLYFFKGDQYVRYTLGQGVDEGFPRPVATDWPEFQF